MEIRKLWSQFLPLWILANMLGWSTYSLIYIVQFFVCGVTVGVGFFISYLQWLILKKYMRVDSMWVWTSTLTYGLYLGILSFIVGFTPANFSVCTLLAIIGMGLLSLFQRSALNYYVNHVDTWIVVNTIASIVALFFAYFSVVRSSNTTPFFVWISYGGVYGVITGITLVQLYKSTLEASRSQSKESGSRMQPL